MNQAFEDLKQDIQNLIDTAGDTIRQIVDQAASRARSSGVDYRTSPPTQGSDGSEFTSQIEELRTKIRNAVDNLKQQAKSALDNPVFSGSGSSGGGTPGTFNPGTVTEPKPGPATGVNEGTAASNNVDDQMPAGGSAQTPNTPAPNFGSTIGPDSFKSGA